MPDKVLSIEQYNSLVGDELGVSRWFEINQDRIDKFGDITEDRQYIHCDPVAAANSPFGSTIAHGYLTLSLLSAMAHDSIPSLAGQKMGMNYGFNSLRFLSPVKVGSRIRGRFTLMNVKERRPGHWQSTFGVAVEIEGETKPAVAAEWVCIMVI